jgi:hypothetical protein
MTFQPVRARFLGYMIVKAATDEGCTNLPTEVCDCVNDAELFELAELYKIKFLTLLVLLYFPCHIDIVVTQFWLLRQRLLLIHTGRPLIQEMLRISFLTTCSGQVLVREWYRCVLTGRFDLCKKAPTLCPQQLL